MRSSTHRFLPVAAIGLMAHIVVLSGCRGADNRRSHEADVADIRRFLAKAEYTTQALPVLDVHYNNTPSLTPSAATPDPHRFETPLADPADPGALRVFHRVR